MKINTLIFLLNSKLEFNIHNIESGDRFANGVPHNQNYLFFYKTNFVRTRGSFLHKF